MKTEEAFRPDFIEASDLIRKSSSSLQACFTCKSCATECPINIFTGRLNPAKLIRYALFGLNEALINVPEIWYCLGCGKCGNICPMGVRPDMLIRYVRYETIRKKVFAKEILNKLYILQIELHKMRILAINKCMQDKGINPVTDVSPPVVLEAKNRYGFVSEWMPTGLSSCFTCRECSTACPVCIDTSVFDPLTIFRSVNLGLLDEMMSSPMIWLCIGCETCTRVCAQGVKGHMIIKWLRELAINKGIIKKDFLIQWHNNQKQVFNGFIEEANKIVYESRR